MKVDLSGLPPQANLGILSQVVAADSESAARHLSNASVAQLDRASVFGTEGWGFESLRVYSTYVDSAFQLYLGTDYRQTGGKAGTAILSLRPAASKPLYVTRLHSFELPTPADLP